MSFFEVSAMNLLKLSSIILFYFYIIVQFRAFFRWRDWWKAGAAVPLMAVTLVFVRILLELALNPTSNILWPVDILVASTTGLAFLGVLALLRKYRMD